jgi:hypothetical protein
VPSGNESAAIPANPGDDYLREALKSRLDKGPASFDFMVQVRDDPKKMPIENPQVAWRKQGSFRKVATIEIPMQTFDTPQRREFGDNLSFNPWRCLPEHRPLGGISRARRQVYRALSAFRHDRNAARLEEPGFAEWDRAMQLDPAEVGVPEKSGVVRTGDADRRASGDGGGE